MEPPVNLLTRRSARNNSSTQKVGAPRSRPLAYFSLISAVNIGFEDFTIGRFVAETNADPKPFIWTANPKRILAAVKRGKEKLVLLRHKFLRRDGPAIGALQHGHRGRLLTSAPISRRRMVAIEFGM